MATSGILHARRWELGHQFGGQRAGVVLIMRSRKAVEAVLKHQGKAGADLGIALGSIGTGLEGHDYQSRRRYLYFF